MISRAERVVLITNRKSALHTLYCQMYWDACSVKFSSVLLNFFSAVLSD